MQIKSSTGTIWTYSDIRNICLCRTHIEMFQIFRISETNRLICSYEDNAKYLRDLTGLIFSHKGTLTTRCCILVGKNKQTTITCILFLNRAPIHNCKQGTFKYQLLPLLHFKAYDHLFQNLCWKWNRSAIMRFHSLQNFISPKMR